MVKNGESTKMLAGEYSSKVVAGVRIAIPSEFRKILGKSCIIAKGYEGSLLLVPTEKWSLIVEPLQKSSFFDRNIRDTLRFLVGSSFTVEPDKQGRIVVPVMLREYSKVNYAQNDSSEVVFVGLVNWVEIWEKSLWEQRLSYVEENADEIAQELKLLQGDPAKQ